MSIYAQDEPYEIPEPPADVDLEIVIGQVGDETITLADFAKRLRFDRYRFFYQPMQDFVGQAGAEALNLEDPNNQFAATVTDFLNQAVDDVAFGQQIYELMFLERIIHQEAQARGLDVTQCDVDEIWGRVLNPAQPIQNCELPDGFEEDRAEYLDLTTRISGLTEAEIERIFVSFAESGLVLEAVGQEVELDDVNAVSTRHIRVNTEETANEVFERLEAGESFDDLLLEYTIDNGIEGNRGELGFFGPGIMAQSYGATFEEAVFAAEAGEIIGPVETPAGFHVIEILDKRPRVSVSHILVETEAEAETVLDLVSGGANFAEVARSFSIDPGSGAQGGNLGTAVINGQTFVPAFEEGVLAATVGEPYGPVETEFGFHVILVNQREDGASVNAQHILVDTEEDAQGVIDRLDAGEDFNELATELSLDPSARGNNGDTLAILTQGQQSGLYVPEETFFEFDQVVFGAEAGDILEPVTVPQFGFFVLLVTETGTRQPRVQDVQFAADLYTQQWLDDQFESDAVETTELWRRYIPTDPMPSVISETLAPLDPLIAEFRGRYNAQREATNLLNTLGSLQAPDDE